MRTFALFLLAAILPSALLAQDRLRIVEVGLDGHCSAAVPTPVRIHIPAPAQSQTLDLLLTVESRVQVDPPSWVRTDRFEKQVALTSGKPLDVDLPILIPAFWLRVLRVVATDTRGQKFGEDSLTLKGDKPGPPIAIYCRDDSRCFEAQKQISTHITDAKTTTPRGDLQFVFLKELRSDWLVYRAAEAVVIADSIADMTPDQSKALEYFLRSGGTVVLVEKEAASASFLSAYRAATDFARVGNGYLYRLPSLESKQLTSLFSILEPSNGVRNTLQQRAEISAVNALLTRIGVSFTFPRLRWLLIWVGVYILVIGLLNFALLKRLRKLEWGWVTMSAAALLFAAGLYISGSSHRPKAFTLDGVVLYSMDAHSPAALEHYGFRISSPDRTQVGLIVDDDVILDSSRSWGTRNDSGAYVGSDLAGTRESRLGWQVGLAPPLKIEVPMRRWSFVDFYAEGFREFAGTVHWTAPMHLKNDTGLKFREAMYFDEPANLVYSIPAMEPNQDVDLASIVPKASPFSTKPAAVWQLLNGKPPSELRVHRPLTTEEAQLLKLAPGRHGFAGEVESPGINARLDVSPATSQSLAVVTVDLDQP